MTEKQALSWAKKTYGKKAWVEWNPKAGTTAEKQGLDIEKDLMRAYSYAPDVRRANKYTIDRLVGLTCRFKATVGKIMLGMFFEVCGQGDSWQEAVEAAKKRIADDKVRYAELRKQATHA